MKAGKIVAMVAVAALAVGGAVALAGWGEGGPCGGWGRGMRGGDGRGPMGFFGRAVFDLDLTAQQREKITAILEQAQPSISALRGQLRSMRQSFRAAQNPGVVDEAAIRAEVTKRAAVQAELAVKLAKVRAEIFSVLTPEQQKQLSEMRGQCQGTGGGRHHGWR